MKLLLLIPCIFLLSSCGHFPEDSSWVQNDNYCHEIDYSYGYLSMTYLNNNDCKVVWARNIDGFMVDMYIECNYDKDGIWRYFRTEDDCLFSNKPRELYHHE